MSIYHSVSLPDDHYIEFHTCPHDKLMTISVGHKNGLDGSICGNFIVELDDVNIPYIIKGLTLMYEEYLELKNK